MSDFTLADLKAAGKAIEFNNKYYILRPNAYFNNSLIDNYNETNSDIQTLNNKADKSFEDILLLKEYKKTLSQLLDEINKAFLKPTYPHKTIYEFITSKSLPLSGNADAKIEDKEVCLEVLNLPYDIADKLKTAIEKTDIESIIDLTNKESAIYNGLKNRISELQNLENKEEKFKAIRDFNPYLFRFLMDRYSMFKDLDFNLLQDQISFATIEDFQILADAKISWTNNKLINSNIRKTVKLLRKLKAADISYEDYSFYLNNLDYNIHLKYLSAEDIKLLIQTEIEWSDNHLINDDIDITIHVLNEVKSMVNFPMKDIKFMEKFLSLDHIKNMDYDLLVEATRTYHFKIKSKFKNIKYQKFYLTEYLKIVKNEEDKDSLPIFDIYSKIASKLSINKINDAVNKKLKVNKLEDILNN